MRVLIASHSAGLRGGAERCVLELASALRVDGRVEPTVTVPARGELSEALEAASVPYRVVTSATWLVDRSPRWPHDPARAARRAKRALRVVRSVGGWSDTLAAVAPDVVMSSTTTTPTPALAARRARIPHVWWIHEFTTRGLDKRYVLGEPLGQRAIGALSRVVAVNSQAAARHYSPPIPAGRVRIVELGVEPPPVAANCLSAHPLRLLVLGRKEPAKGCADAIRAVAACRDAGDDVVLRLVGPSVAGYAAELWGVARDLDVLDRVEFEEYVRDPRDQLEWCNVLLSCAAGEAFGRVVIEALKGGRGVIGARGGATVELLDDGVNGLLYEPGDVAALAAAVGRCARDRDLLARLSRRAVESTVGRFSLRGEVETFVAIFAAATAGRGAGVGAAAGG